MKIKNEKYIDGISLLTWIWVCFELENDLNKRNNANISTKYIGSGPILTLVNWKPVSKMTKIFRGNIFSWIDSCLTLGLCALCLKGIVLSGVITPFGLFLYNTPLFMLIVKHLKIQFTAGCLEVVTGCCYFVRLLLRPMVLLVCLQPHLQIHAAISLNLYTRSAEFREVYQEL